MTEKSDVIPDNIVQFPSPRDNRPRLRFERPCSDKVSRLITPLFFTEIVNNYPQLTEDNRNLLLEILDTKFKSLKSDLTSSPIQGISSLICLAGLLDKCFMTENGDFIMIGSSYDNDPQYEYLVNIGNDFKGLMKKE